MTLKRLRKTVAENNETDQHPLFTTFEEKYAQDYADATRLPDLRFPDPREKRRRWFTQIADPQQIPEEASLLHGYEPTP